MRKLILIPVLLLALAIVLVAGGCRKEPEAKPQLKIPQVESESAPEQAEKGPDTVVPEDTTLDGFVRKYYQAYKDKRWEEAYQMQAAGRKAQESLEAFVSARSGMPLDGFEVDPPAIAGNTAEVKAELQLAGMSGGQPWITTWMFSKKGDDWVVEGTKSAVKQ